MRSNTIYKLILIVVLSFQVNILFAQYQVMKVNGTYCMGEQATFVFTGSGCSLSWSISGGTIVSQSNPMVTVQWTSSTAQLYLNYNCSGTTGSSNTGWLSIGTKVTPTISISADKNNVCVGTSIKFTASITNGGSSPTYYWKVNGGTAPGATNSSTYTTSALSNNDVVTCMMVTSLLCYNQQSATSTGITMILTPKQVMTVTVSGPGTLCGGSPIGDFYANVSNGAGTLSYKWFKNGIQQASTSNPLTGLSLNNGDLVRCEVSSSDVCVQSPAISSDYTAVVTGLQTFTAGTSPSVVTMCPGESVTFTANYSHTPSSYQWQMNGSNVAGATQSTFITTATSVTQLQSVRVLVTTSATCLSNTTATGSAQAIPFTLKPLPNATITGSATGCGNTTLQASTGTGYTYAWKNGYNTTVGTESSYTATSSDLYRLTTTLNGCSNDATPLSVTIVPIPAAPSGLITSGVTKSTFQANWGSVSGASGYKLDVSTSSTFGSFVTGYNNLSVTGTSKDVTGLTPNQLYYFRVRTESNGCTSANSANGSVTTLLTEPVTTASTAFTTTSFTVNWGAVTGAASYRLDVSTVNTFASFVGSYNNLTVSGTSQNVTGLVAGTTYYYRVRAVNATGTSANSTTGSSITLTSAPVLSTTASIATTSFTVNWGAETGASSYRLDVSAVNNFASFVGSYNNLTVSGTNQSVTGLTAGTTYYYRVRAVNASGTSANSTTGNSITLTVAPTLSASTAFTTTSFTVNWGAVTGAASYRLDVSTVNTFASFVGSYNNLTVSGTSQSVTGLIAGATYYCRVRVVNASGTSANSATGSSLTLTAAPAFSASTAFTTTSFTVNWGAVTGAASYLLDVSTVSTFTTYLSGYNNLSLTVLTRNITGLTAGTTYYYRIRAANVSGNSAYSTTGSSITLTAAPTFTASTAFATTSFTVNWGAVTGAASYRLDVSTVNTFASFVGSYNNLMVSGTSQSVTGLLAGTTYYYRVRAVNATGTSANSTTGSSITLTVAPALSASTVFTTTSFTVNWGAVTGAASYRLDVSTVNTFASYVSGYNNLTITGVNRSVTGLTAGTTYYYRVRAVNASGASANSATGSSPTLTSAPTLSASTALTTTSFTVNWGAVTGATSYRLDVSTVNTFASFVSGYNNLTVSGTSQNVTGLSANTTYYFRLRAVNASGTSANSSTNSSLTLPAAPNTPSTFTFCEWETKVLTTTGYPSGGTLRWYDSSGVTLLFTGITFTQGNMAPGTYTYRIKSQNSAGVESSGYAIATLIVPVNCDQKLNWSKTTSYGVDGSEVASAIQYTDGFGNPMQSQSKAYTGSQVFASQPLYDRLGNASASTLPAPINGSAFSYRHNFVTNASGQRYGSADFDMPAGSGQGSYNDPKPVANGGIGTLGWYYSTSNTMEPATPTTSYPYARSYTAEGPNPTTSKSTGPGNAYKMGSGKEVTSDRYQIQVGELDHYFNIRRHLVPTSTPYTANLLASVTTTNTSQFNAVYATVTSSGGYINAICSANLDDTPGVFPIGGDIAVTANKTYTFRVKGYRVSSSNVNLRVTTNGGWVGGLPVGTNIQWPGALLPLGSANEGWVSTTFTVPAGVTSIRVGVIWDQPTVGHSIKISAVELKAEVPTASIGYKYITTDPDGKRTASFVDIEGRTLASALVTSSTGIPPTSFTYDYWSYSYYNEMGQLVASVAPNGVNTANTNAPTFVTTYKYDHMGRLIETTAPDEGTSQFVYSLDGKIRFSQNQLQRDASPKRFSYTNYDYYGRLVESGEYTSSGTNPYVFEPHTVTTPSTYSVLNIADRILSRGKNIEGGTAVTDLGLTRLADATRCTDYAYMVYDVIGSGYPTDALHTAQQIKFGQLSKTENALSKTWYSYNEFGEVVWTKQSATTVGNKTVDYTYDYLGKVTEVAYQKGQTDAFYHHYTYDADQRLIEVRTSTDGVNKTLHAKYKYYLHGPLKRVEIAGKKQGIDYVYTITGAVKAINSGDPSKDLGKDGISGANATFMKDLFGETFHYYDNDYTATHSTESVNLTGASPAYPGLYGGLPRAIGYHNVTDKDAGGNKMHIYGYQYDARNQLSDARWGSVTGSNITFTTNQRENISGYDKNGNIQALLRNGKAGQTIGNYGYVYEANTNKLDKVNHNSALLTDYTYNTLGQMIQQVEGANTYKYAYTPYGKVKDVKNASNQLVQSYHYDDRGGLLKKVSYNAGTATKETYYISDASGNTLSVYEKPMPSGSVTQMELSVYGSGRLATYKPADKFFYYEINDHQGSVRVVMGVSLPDKIVGTLETATVAQDRANFLRYDNAKRINAAIFDRTNGSSPGFSQRLNGGTNEKYGMAKSLAVNAGDTVLMEVYAKYVDRTAQGQWTTALGTLMGQILSGTGGIVIEGGTYSSSTSSFLAGNMVNNSGSTGTGPKVFLNYLSFDAGYVAITDPSQTNFIRITTAAKETGTDIVHERMYAQVVVKQAGYMYIYFSNEDATGNYEAYFDDFTVTHTKFKVYKAEDYYPFGLAMDGNTYTDPYRYGYQGQYSEKDATTGLNEFELRMYEARFGRWISPDPYGQFASPYIGMGNSPHTGVDPDGGYSLPIGIKGALIGAAVGATFGLAFDKDNWGWYALGGSAVGSLAGTKAFRRSVLGHYEGVTYGGDGVYPKNPKYPKPSFTSTWSVPPISKIAIPAARVAETNFKKEIPPIDEPERRVPPPGPPQRIYSPQWDADQSGVTLGYGKVDNIPDYCRYWMGFVNNHIKTAMESSWRNAQLGYPCVEIQLAPGNCVSDPQAFAQKIVDRFNKINAPVYFLPEALKIVNLPPGSRAYFHIRFHDCN